jgi:D-alanyl-D-alanine-carboxypeptidase/D-alanyl-D-alanine-endopeptidase
MATEIHRRAVIGAAPLAALGLTAAAQPASATWSIPSNREIEKALAERIDVQRQGVGIVVGIVEPKGRRIITHGAAVLGRRQPPLDGNTVFEIGSMTKVFTSLLLADMVRRGEVTLDEPVGKLLPSTVHVPERGGRQITLADLASHVSGLPRLPTNLPYADPGNPYADYTVERLYAFLNSYTLPRDIGAQIEYSNLGVGLLGHALALRAGQDYETLVRTRITAPLGMRDTAIALSPALRARMAQGYNDYLEPVSNWDLPALAGAGGLRSTANDLLTFLAAELGFVDTPLKAAMDAQLIPRRTFDANTEIALAWLIFKSSKGDLVSHSGGTGGFRSCFGFDPSARVGFVVLTNQVNPAGADDIAGYLMGRREMAVLKPSPQALSLPPAALAAFVGVYEVDAQARMTVTQRGPHLFAQITGQANFEIFPSGPDEVFWKVVAAQMTFQRDAAGAVTGAIIHRDGVDTPVRRLSAPEQSHS